METGRPGGVVTMVGFSAEPVYVFVSSVRVIVAKTSPVPGEPSVSGLITQLAPRPMRESAVLTLRNTNEEPPPSV